MKKAIYLILIVWILSPGFKINGQYDNDYILTREIPPSPNQATLGKYGDIPVSLNKGVPTIDIPIWELYAGGIRLPVSLSYHAGGVRVSEIPGWVGSGWSLMAGGSISRTVRGLRDEIHDSFLDVESEIPANLSEGYKHENTAPEYNFYKTYELGSKNAEFDIYNYNFGNYAGKFIIDGDKNIHLIPYVPIEITPEFNISNEVIKFTIKTEDGTTYIFDEPGYVWPLPSSDMPSRFHENDYYVNSWNLSEISSAISNEKIYFTYKMVVYEYALPPTTKIIVKPERGHLMPNRCPETVQHMMVKELYLDHIYSKDGCIKFNISARTLEGHDIEGMPQLSSMDIYGFTEDISNFQASITAHPAISTDSYWNGKISYIKSYEFNYNYQTNRLTLTSLIEKHNSETNAAYSFTYTGSLPGFASTAIDHWGYYNGKTANQHTVPKSQYITDGADRTCNPDVVYNGMLKKINYPTGGYSEFDFEANTASVDWIIDDFVYSETGIHVDAGEGISYKVAGAQVAALTECSASVNAYDILEDILSTIGYTGLSDYYKLQDYNTENGGRPEFTYFIPQISGETELRYFFNFGESDVHDCYCDGTDACAIIYLKNVSKNTYTIIEHSAINDEGTEMVNLIKGDLYVLYIALFDPAHPMWSTGGMYSEHVPTVAIDIPVIDHEIVDAVIEAGTIENYLTTQLKKELPCSGVRIKKITSFDGEKTTVKSYSYHKNGDLNESSGKLSSYPWYSYKQESGTTAIVSSLFHLTVRYDQIVNSDNSLNGTGRVDYGHVTEYYQEIDGSNLTSCGDYCSEMGKTEYFYHINSDHVVDWGFPWVPVQNNSELNKLYAKEIYSYNKGTNGYEKQKSSSYLYDNITISEVKGMKVGALKVNIKMIPQNGISHHYVAQAYTWYSRWNYLNRMTEKEYGLGGQEKTTVYTYDKLTHFQLTATREELSNGKFKITKFRYPYDYSCSSCNDDNYPSFSPQVKAIIDLQKQHRLNTVIEKIEFITDDNTDIVQSASIVEYNNSSGYYMPVKVYNHENPGEDFKNSFTNSEITSTFTLQKDNDYKLKYTNTYDSYGNLVQQVKTDDVVVSYDYGYNYRFPISKTIDGDGTTGTGPTLTTTYKYDPLYGVVIEITSPNGIKTYYEYDNFGRLKTVKDNDGNILQEYDYHYKNQ